MAGNGIPLTQGLKQMMLELQPVKDQELASPQKQNETLGPLKNISLNYIGIEDVSNELLNSIARPLFKPEPFQRHGVQPPRAILLQGPPGCGKSMVAKFIARELKLPLIAFSAPSLISEIAGESEKRLQEIFHEARENAPCLMFIDQIDAIASKRDTTQWGIKRRVVTQMVTCLENLTLENTGGKPVMIISATNQPDCLDRALKRSGWFDKEFCLGVPDEVRREKILSLLCKKMRLSDDFDFKRLAKSTSGFVRADLCALAVEATAVAGRKFGECLEVPPVDMDLVHVGSPLLSIPVPALAAPRPWPLGLIEPFPDTDQHQLIENQLDQVPITISDFLTALAKVHPSWKRDGFTIPNVAWAEVGALESLKLDLQIAIVKAIEKPEAYVKFNHPGTAGVLLWGPPGCGKTLLAEAVANESKANFISIRGPEFLDKYGEGSGRAISQVFSRARSEIPCVIFFDELDALAPRLHGDLSESCARVVYTLSSELDNIEDRKGIYIIGATSKPDLIDPAILRAGKLGKYLFVDLPDARGRKEILQVIAQTTALSGVDLEVVARETRCEMFSGADLEALVTEAGNLAVERTCSPLGAGASRHDAAVMVQDLVGASARVRPTLSEADIKRYRDWEMEGGSFL